MMNNFETVVCFLGVVTFKLDPTPANETDTSKVV